MVNLSKAAFAIHDTGFADAIKELKHVNAIQLTRHTKKKIVKAIRGKEVVATYKTKYEGVDCLVVYFENLRKHIVMILEDGTVKFL